MNIKLFGMLKIMEQNFFVKEKERTGYTERYILVVVVHVIEWNPSCELTGDDQ